MPDTSSLDPFSILASLNITDATDVKAVTGGFDTAIWQITWHDQVYALRVFRPEQANTYQNEVLAMNTADISGIPVPLIEHQGYWQDRPVLLLSWIAGTTLASALGSHPHRFWTIGKAFGRTQAAIHAIPVSSNIESTSWIEWAGDEPELKDRLYHLPSRKTALLHLDYHPLNVMVHNGKISGVLDWANARGGDPRADFARTYAILRIETYTPTGDSLAMAIKRRLLERAWRSGYIEGGGKLEDMALFYAWAGASMIRDLSPRISKTDHWLQDHHLDSVRKWRDHWKKQAGIN